MKFILWFPGRCLNPFSVRQLYDFHWSNISGEPGLTHFSITRSNISNDLSGPGTINKRLDVRSNPPKTHCQVRSRSLLYMRFPIVSSSISTIILSPPI